MSSDTPSAERHPHRYNIFIPAGVLIGLGVGILVNQIGAGVLIGLGFGMIAAALAAPYEAGAGGAGTPPGVFSGVNWIIVAVGIFIVLIGLGFVWTLPFVWPYLIAVILILLGVSFVIRALRHP